MPVNTTTSQGLHATLFGFSQTLTDPADAYNAFLTPSSGTITALTALGPFAVAIDGRQFAIDTSFEPYRREAFRHRTIPAQRESINLTNIAGEGTVNTEGLWRRGQDGWSMGMGQQFVDRTRDSQEDRYYTSKGVDVFTNPFQATLLNDTKNVVSTTYTKPLISRCGDYAVIVTAAPSGSTTHIEYTLDWSTFTPMTSAGIGTVVNSICSNDSYIYVATDTGIFYGQPSSGAALTKFVDVDTGSYNGGYDMVRWCNEQLICSRKNRLYAISPNHSVGAPPNNSLLSISTLTVASGLATVTLSTAHGYWTGTGNPQFGVTISGNASAGNNGFFTATATGANTFTYATTGTTNNSGTAQTANTYEVLFTHNNPQWVWSDATTGLTQVYIAGYVSGSSSNYSGCIYRCSLTLNSVGVIQPFTLNSPVQTLPMSPDEYPTCIQSYLNFIFVGTNKGIRMCQTLNIYDPGATALGDLKSGPYIPNILQPVSSPVTGIVGDGRFVWFAWSNYDGVSTGLGKLDLTTFIAGDPLAPAYVSDLMAGNAGTPIQGLLTGVDWDPINNGPVFAVAGKGVYSIDNTKYVASGTINSGVLTYGIPDNKIPVFFDFNAGLPTDGTGTTSITATITTDPLDGAVSVVLPTIGPITQSNWSQATPPNPELVVSQGYSAEQFQVVIGMFSDSDQSISPTLYRWTLKSWPQAVSETSITPVLMLFDSVVDPNGQEMGVDPYDAFNFLENLRRTQKIVTYQEGPLTAQVVVDAIDWLPHKLRDNYQNGFEGDAVVTLKTIGGYTLNPVPTS